MTCESVHSWRLYSAAPLVNQAVSTMTCYPTQSHYPVTEPTNPCPILIMPSTWLGRDKYKFDKSLIRLDHGFMISRARNPCPIASATAPGL